MTAMSTWSKEQADRAGRGRAPQVQRRAIPDPDLPPNQYHLMLTRIGLSSAVIIALEDLGLDNVESFHDITEKDVPSIIKELQRGGILIKQTSQSYLQALCYWVMRQERLQHNYLPEQFDLITMHYSLQ
jgi:hypothetical protein